MNHTKVALAPLLNLKETTSPPPGVLIKQNSQCGKTPSHCHYGFITMSLPSWPEPSRPIPSHTICLSLTVATTMAGTLTACTQPHHLSSLDSRYHHSLNTHGP
ncbi:hypothetical protein PoB_003887100 [Plakobranchus ocellatus]|uniref:Uncharacterized protein n=1 Tax=Plakobranchus ocellatus TaxID=259542 RepID=A0AAV4AW12_9GAST|nr:hypothetical protein PoB_003887100 [Plakobranchus ocellatus]